MDILFLLIPMSVLLVFAIIGLFAWSLQSGQFEDLEREGERILRQEPDAIDVFAFRDSPNPVRTEPVEVPAHREPVEESLVTCEQPFDRLRANGVVLSPNLESPNNHFSECA